MTYQNPLFPSSNDTEEPDKPAHYALPSNNRVIQPLSTASELREAQARETETSRDIAADTIRRKLDEIYADEPAADQELEEVAHHHKAPSKHQQYLQNLQQSATSVAQIQTAWHQYYISLPEEEKHEVWREFYSEQAKHPRYAQFSQEPAAGAQTTHAPQQPKQPDRNEPAKPVISTHHELSTPSASAKRVRRKHDERSPSQVKDTIRHNISANSRRQAKPSGLRSMLFGLGMGTIALLIMMFGLFNEMVVAPFIQPSRNVSATPIILTNNSVDTSGGPKIIIPKINVEIPVDYSLESLDEDIVQKGLENGVVHYPVTSRPGEKGNAAFFGHSSNNIFNPGKYKFAFVLLSRLQDGDMFYLTYEGKSYAYRVFKKQVVAPNETWVLGPVKGKAATVALITCDPPGTTLKRLIVWGEQISPDPSTAGKSSANASTIQSETPDLPGPAQSLWDRFTDWLF